MGRICCDRRLRWCFELRDRPRGSDGSVRAGNPYLAARQVAPFHENKLMGRAASFTGKAEHSS